jgi:hypothetical protein
VLLRQLQEPPLQLAGRIVAHDLCAVHAGDGEQLAVDELHECVFEEGEGRRLALLLVAEGLSVEVLEDAGEFGEGRVGAV